jgi:alpha-tubulin suppressor-like RCC1 family protein
MVRCQDGSVFACGFGLDGALGVGSREDHAVFARVALPRPAVKIACGAGHSAAVLDDGRLFMWGRGVRCGLARLCEEEADEPRAQDSGQLGRGSTHVDEAVGARRLTPTLVDFFSKFRVLDVALGGDHSLVICSER